MEDKKVEVEDEKKVVENPQILEMQQTMTELNTKFGQANELIAQQSKEIEEMRAASIKVTTDKLEQEKDLKAKFGVTETAAPKRSKEDINALSNSEVFEVVADVLDSAINAHREEATTEMELGFKNLDTKFDSIVGHIMKKEADITLKEVRSANPDFDKYKDDIREVLKVHQEFSIEDAYDWVKMKENKGQVAAKHTDSEKPDVDLSAADEDVVRKKRQPEGRKLSRNRQLRITIEEAIDKVQARRGGS